MGIEIPDFMQANLNETLIIENQRAYRECLWTTVLNLRPFKDGNKWCVLYGKDLMDGIYAFGDTPEQAVIKFDDAFRDKNGSKI